MQVGVRPVVRRVGARRGGSSRKTLWTMIALCVGMAMPGGVLRIRNTLHTGRIQCSGKPK